MKKISILHKLLCLALVLCTVLATAVACTNEEDVKQTGELTNAKTEDLYDEQGFLKDALPDNLDYGEVVRIVVSESQKNNVYQEELSENVIANAIYNRGLTVEERLGIEIEWIPMDATWNANRNTFFQHIQSTSDAGQAYDALCLYNLMPGALASRGSLTNIGNTKYVDLTAPWWPSDFVKQVVIDDVLYSLVENSSRGTLYNLHGVFFNNELIEDYKLNSPYDMVKDNTWTFANMMALVKDTYSDKDNTPGKSNGDFYGIMTGTEAKIETWFFGMGYKYATKNDAGELELMMNDMSYMLSWFDEFNAATATNDFLLWDKNGHTKAFFAGNAILYMSAIRLVDNGVNQGVEMDYGIVPVPKKDSSQENYITNVANSHDMWCVPTQVSDIDMSSAILECMASESYRQVAPVYFDQCIKLRYAPDERLAEMYDLIRSSIVFDFCAIYSFAFDNVPRTILHEVAKNPSSITWNDQWERYGQSFETGFANMLKIYTENAD